MSQSTRCLAPHLQELWTRVYAIAWGHNAYQDTEGNPKNAHEKAEEAAWEAVARANGGVSPREPETIDELAPIIGPILWSDEWKDETLRPSIIAAARTTILSPDRTSDEVRAGVECALAVWIAIHGCRP